jgi:hypothetical protein
MDSANQTEPKDRLAFEKARLDYCMDLFNREEQRKEQLERKSQFYLSFITLFLGAIFLKADSLTLLKELTENKPVASPLLTVLYLSIIVLGVLILFSVMAILGVTRLWSYKGPYPKDIVYAFFSPDSGYIKENTQPELIRIIAMNFAVALEDNIRINDRKSKWIIVCSYGIFSAVTVLAILLSIIVYISIYY